MTHAQQSKIAICAAIPTKKSVIFYDAEFLEVHKKLNITMEKTLDTPIF